MTLTELLVSFTNFQGPAAVMKARTRQPRQRPMNTYEYQFHPPRFTELMEKHRYYQYKISEYVATKNDAPSTFQRNPEDAQKWVESELKKIADAVELSEDEVKEKEMLADQGFTNWTKRELQLFIKACERYGRDNLAAISRDVEGKTPDEVKAYYAVFWKRYQEIPDHDKIIKAIERGEERLLKNSEAQKALTMKVSKYAIPQQQMKIVYGGNKGKLFSDDEDRFLVIFYLMIRLFIWRNSDGVLKICTKKLDLN